VSNENETTETGELFSAITQAIFGGTPTEQFIKGAAIGATIAYLLTNKSAQDAIIKTVVKAGTSIAQNLAEIKERIADAQAEIQEEMSKQQS
jgi:hypothetical protein